VCCGGKGKGGRLYYERIVTGNRRVLMSRELRRLVYNTKCSDSRRNAYGRKFTTRIEF
jgi:hypothetical protein